LSSRCSLRNVVISDTVLPMMASVNVANSEITPAQSRAARGLLDWPRDVLAECSGVNKRTILRFEAAEGDTRPATLAAIRTALEAAGVEFTNGDAPGVRLKTR